MDYIKTLFSVENKVVVITGGSGILGGEIAKGFVNAGAKVVLLGLQEEKIAKRIASLKTNNDTIVGFQCNVLNEDHLHTVAKQIIDKFKRIDILINAAGGNMAGATIESDQTIFDLQIDDYKKVTDLNLNGTVFPTLIFGKLIVEQKKGSIINIASMASYRAITRVLGYSVAKAAIVNFTQWMAVEFAKKFGSGIRVNAIAPGFLLTEQNRSLLTNADGTLTERGKAVIAMTPFSRFGEPEELVGTTLWLASDASQFVTGITIPIDGGFSSFSGV